jgi:hypothetical protein
MRRVPVRRCDVHPGGAGGPVALNTDAVAPGEGCPDPQRPSRRVPTPCRWTRARRPPHRTHFADARSSQPEFAGARPPSMDCRATGDPGNTLSLPLNRHPGPPASRPIAAGTTPVDCCVNPTASRTAPSWAEPTWAGHVGDRHVEVPAGALRWVRAHHRCGRPHARHGRRSATPGTAARAPMPDPPAGVPRSAARRRAAVSSWRSGPQPANSTGERTGRDNSRARHTGVD